MPPVRTPSARNNKTERTHEENVERAFIAASRRSDRTLEARVESAKRASEIHKARTGRGLRITAKDVQNEEMYEEEDDDLPLQYRHLTAGFQTSSPEFNRRFAAYLTTHVAIRTALEQSIIQSYQQQQQQQEQQQQQQQPGQSLPCHTQPKQYEMFPSPFISHHAQQTPWTISPPQGSSANRYSPYPILSRINVATPKAENSKPHTKKIMDSITTDSSNAEVPTEVNHIPNLTPNNSYLSPATAPVGYSPFRFSFACEKMPQLNKTLQSEDSQREFTTRNNIDLTSFGPLSTNLPAETQALLGPSMGFGNTSGGLSSMLNPQEGVEDSFEPALKSCKPSTEPRDENKTVTCGLEMTLLREASTQDSPFLFESSNYFDDALRTDSSLTLTSTSASEENDWSHFVESSDWSFSEDCSII